MFCRSQDFSAAKFDDRTVIICDQVLLPCLSSFVDLFSDSFSHCVFLVCINVILTLYLSCCLVREGISCWLST